MANGKYSEDIKQLVIQRVKAMPVNIKLYFGSNIKLSQNEIIEAIENDEEIGREIIEMHLKYLRAIKNMVV